MEEAVQAAREDPAEALACTTLPLMGGGTPESVSRLRANFALSFSEVVRTNFSTCLLGPSLSECGVVVASGPDDTASRAGHHLERQAIMLGPQVAPVILDHFPARPWQRCTIVLQHIDVF